MATLTTYLDSSPSDYPLQVETVYATITAAQNDVVQMFSVKRGFMIHEIILSFEGTASSTVTVGDGADADRFIISASTASNGLLRMTAHTTISSSLAATGAGYKYTTDDTIDLVIGGAGVTAKAYALTVIYTRTYNS